MARVLSLSEAKTQLSRLVADCEKDEEELVITRNGRPAAVLISADEYEGWRETREIMRNRALMREIRQGLRQLEKGRRFTFEEVFGEPLRPRKRQNDPLWHRHASGATGSHPPSPAGVKSESQSCTKINF